MESSPGKGAAFTVLLPAWKRTSGLEQAETVGPLPRGRERILVIDDEPALADIVKRMLEKLGYDVVAGISGVDAMEVFGRQSVEKQFDLVVADMTMPHFTGADLARELCGLRAAVPVILMTGFSRKMDAQKARDLGIRGFLMKPVAFEELAKTVRNVLDEKKI